MTEPLVIAGPTASGKSAVAAQLARALGAEVVNVDPFQAWQGMAVLTAQPGEQERALAPHHLYGVLDPGEDRDAGGFAVLVRATMRELAARNIRCLLVSGSGMYLTACTRGLDPGLPPADPAVRAELEAMTMADLLAELAARDPVEYGRIDRNNPRRVVRAVEILRLTGRTVSSLRTQRDTAPTGGPCGWWLDLEPEVLKLRIHTRAERMLGPGLERELEALDKRRLCRSATQTLGLDIARAWRDGRILRADAVAQLATRTWQYARRQRTWFRRARDLRALAVAGDPDPTALAARIQTAC